MRRTLLALLAALALAGGLAGPVGAAPAAAPPTTFPPVYLQDPTGLLPTGTTLLHLRDIAAKAGRPFSIVSEMLDVRNRQLAEVTRADDFIVSDKLISLMLSQIAENAQLAAVFADLLDPEGSELYLKPASGYVALDRPVSFYTVVEAARRRGEVALGYRLTAESADPAKAYGVRVNPDKSRPVRFAAGDRVIVLAEA